MRLQSPRWSRCAGSTSMPQVAPQPAPQCAAAGTGGSSRGRVRPTNQRCERVGVRRCSWVCTHAAALAEVELLCRFDGQAAACASRCVGQALASAAHALVPAPAPAGRSCAELPVLHSCRSSGYCSSHLLQWQVVLRRLALPLVSLHPATCLKAPANIPSTRMVPVVSQPGSGSPNLAFTPVLLDGSLLPLFVHPMRPAPAQCPAAVASV
jgi:hypothetical protein